MEDKRGEETDTVQFIIKNLLHTSTTTDTKSRHKIAKRSGLSAQLMRLHQQHAAHLSQQTVEVHSEPNQLLSKGERDSTPIFPPTTVSFTLQESSIESQTLRPQSRLLTKTQSSEEPKHIIPRSMPLPLPPIYFSDAPLPSESPSDGWLPCVIQDSAKPFVVAKPVRLPAFPGWGTIPIFANTPALKIAGYCCIVQYFPILQYLDLTSLDLGVIVRSCRYSTCI